MTQTISKKKKKENKKKLKENRKRLPLARLQKICQHN